MAVNNPKCPICEEDVKPSDFAIYHPVTGEPVHFLCWEEEVN